MIHTNLIDPGGLELSSREKVFYQRGFDCFPKGTQAVCFRQFFTVSQLTPLYAQRLKKLGAKPADEISLCFSESDNLVSVCVLARDIFMEHEADSTEGANLLWAFGITFP